MTFARSGAMGGMRARNRAKGKPRLTRVKGGAFERGLQNGGTRSEGVITLIGTEEKVVNVNNKNGC